MKIIITILLSATFIYLHDPSWNPLSTSRNGQDIYDHINIIRYIYSLSSKLKSSGCAAPNFTPCTPSHRQADEMYYEDEGETGQKQSADMY